MVRPQPEGVRIIENFIEALAELRLTTRATESMARKALKLVKEGADVATALQACSPADTRAAMNDALNAVETARHIMRLRIFRRGLEEGLSIGELGRIFGFSRQLASRYAREAKGVTEAA